MRLEEGMKKRMHANENEGLEKPPNRGWMDVGDDEMEHRLLKC
jgi:hypothetical protein